MPDPDFDDMPDDEDFDLLFEYDPIFNQLLTERWMMEILLHPPKAPKAHPIDKLTWMAGSMADLAVVLASLEQDGLIERDGNSVSATRAAISFRRLELRQAEPR